MEKHCRECGKKIANSQNLCDNCRAKRNGWGEVSNIFIVLLILNFIDNLLKEMVGE